MSFQDFCDNLGPKIDLTRDNVIDLLLASIAFEELGLAHLVNAQAEEIQSVLGTLDGLTVKSISVSEVERLNISMSRALQNIIKKEMILEFKIGDVLEIPTATTSSTTSTTTTTTTSSTTTTTTTSSSITTTSTTMTTTTTSATPTTTSTTSNLCGCNMLTTFEESFDFVFGMIENPSDPYFEDFARLFADICGNCQSPENSFLDYSITRQGVSIYTITPNLATIEVQCPESGIIISGSGTATDLTLPLSSPATFTLTVTDNSPDTFRMVVNADNNALDHDSGTIELTDFEQGDIIVASCASLAATKLHSDINLAKLPQLRDRLRERMEKFMKQQEI